MPKAKAPPANPLIVAIASKNRPHKGACLPDRMNREQRRQFFGLLRHVEQLEQDSPHLAPTDKQIAETIQEAFGFRISRQAIQMYRRHEHDWSRWPESAG